MAGPPGSRTWGAVGVDDQQPAAPGRDPGVVPRARWTGRAPARAAAARRGAGTAGRPCATPSTAVSTAMSERWSPGSPRMPRAAAGPSPCPRAGSRTVARRSRVHAVEHRVGEQQQVGDRVLDPRSAQRAHDADARARPLQGRPQAELGVGLILVRRGAVSTSTPRSRSRYLRVGSAASRRHRRPGPGVTPSQRQRAAPPSAAIDQGRAVRPRPPRRTSGPRARRRRPRRR